MSVIIEGSDLGISWDMERGWVVHRWRIYLVSLLYVARILHDGIPPSLPWRKGWIVVTTQRQLNWMALEPAKSPTKPRALERADLKSIPMHEGRTWALIIDTEVSYDIWACCPSTLDSYLCRMSISHKDILWRVTAMFRWTNARYIDHSEWLDHLVLYTNDETFTSRSPLW